MRRLLAVTRAQREEVLTKEIKAGNTPAFMSKFVTVYISGIDAKASSTRLHIRFLRTTFALEPIRTSSARH